GRADAEIGGGRARVTDRIDPHVGFLVEAGLGDEVRSGDALGLLYCRDEAQGAEAAARIRAAYAVEDARPPARSLIKQVIGA
ncbi:MAG TPA: hypothetical protein VEQ42_01140, partial [Pyrinomonadaceae bacterium]|nr:hypothetical protein [Pyrinomonadaceae bacterium]